jgi:hypothetical protein
LKRPICTIAMMCVVGSWYSLARSVVCIAEIAAQLRQSDGEIRRRVYADTREISTRSRVVKSYRPPREDVINRAAIISCAIM